VVVEPAVEGKLGGQQRQRCRLAVDERDEASVRCEERVAEDPALPLR